MCKILSRIDEIARLEGVSIAQIEKSIGASRGVISKAIKNGTDIQSKWLSLICDNFPKYSAQWLLTGNGSMYNSQTITNDEVHIVETDHLRPSIDSERYNGTNTRPRIPFEAAAGSLSIAIDSINESDCERFPVIPTFPKYDFTIITRGDSMSPDFLSGDELACSFIRNSRFIQWGRPHVLDTAQGIVVKRIFDHDSESLICRSINPDYPDFEISKDEIYHIALVVGLIRHF